MAIDGSVLEINTIPEVEEDYFSPDFKEYVQKEQLNCSRFEGYRSDTGWVFWSQRDPDHQTQLDNYLDLIRHALQKLVLKKEFHRHLVQFWAATKTSEGRTLLTTQFQPFALGPTFIVNTYARNRLCEYRMGMCREYNNSFYADAECPEEQLGVPGRVFLHQFPESTPNVQHYTLKEYPQLYLAVHCEIGSSWAVPVFDHSTQACVGVLEIVSLLGLFPLWPKLSFLGQICDIFQEFGLQCFDGCKHYEMQIGDIARTTAFKELKTVLKTVCEIHELPLAMTWVPCIACDDLQRGQLLQELPVMTLVPCSASDDLLQVQLVSEGVEFFRKKNCFSYLAEFVEFSKCSHIRRGGVAGMVLSYPNILYCSDITQLSLAEYPLVLYAEQCKLRGWFTVCLQSSHTANDVYLVELFLPTSGRYRDNSWTSLSLILGTMEENFRSFKLASGHELGDLLQVVVMDFQNGRKNHSVQYIQATRFSRDPELVKPASRDYVIHHQSPCDTDMVGCSRSLPGEDQEQDPSRNSDHRSNESSASVCKLFRDWKPLPGEDQEQEPSLDSYESTARFCNMVTIRVKVPGYDYNLKFSLSSSARFVELQQEVVKRLNHLEAGTYYVFYNDEENERTLIACDKDWQDCIRTFRSLGRTLVVVLLEPITN